MPSPSQDAKRRRTLETMALKKLAARKAGHDRGRFARPPFAAVDANASPPPAASVVGGVARVPRRRVQFPPAPPPRAPGSAPSPTPMDAEAGDDEDVSFGARESFASWLARVGLRGPHDADRGETRITAAQREELERLWCGAAETDALRVLVENLKDGELEMARREQAAAEGWAEDFERATESAWRDRVRAASAAEDAARRELAPVSDPHHRPHET